MELDDGQDIDDFLQALAPRKPYWDLRRGIQDKLDLLDRKTQKSIQILSRKKLESGKLAAAVNSAPTTGDDE